MAFDPGTVSDSARGVSALLGFVKTPSVWIGRKVGITSAPNLVFGPLGSGALPNEARPAYAGDGYLVIPCVNRQRTDLRSRFLTTQDVMLPWEGPCMVGVS